MEEFGITCEAIAESIEADLENAPKYRDARGNEWNGHGEMPDWIRAAKHAGVDPGFFLIAAIPTARTDPGSMIDPRQLKLFGETA